MKFRILLRVLAACMLSILVAGSFPQVASANTYIVTNTLNSGAGSLRQAILDANSNPGLDTISFSIPGSGVHTIQPVTGLPTIDDPVIIDGLTQSGASAGNLWEGIGHTLLIELDGSLVAGSPDGLKITAGGSTVRGLVIHSFPGYGIFLSTSGSNTIETNYIGTDTNGEGDLGNAITGIFLNNVGSNTIGGSDPGAGNLISGNDQSGILIEGSSAGSNSIKGNFIGTHVNGEQKISNGVNGITINDAPWNVIGESGVYEGNLISGNDDFGVWISGTGAYSNRVRGNYIGTTRHGTVLPADVGNGMDGVYINAGDHNIVGGDGVDHGNVISGNVGNGVHINGSQASSNEIFSNYIGTDKDGAAVLANGGDGVMISGGASYTAIGGGSAGEGNLISGNDGNGVSIQNLGSSFNTVEGNLIGTDITGAIDLGNAEHGIQISSGGHYNTVGGDTAMERNVISGNAWSGIQITGVATDYSFIKGNYIGTDITGTLAIPNDIDGVVIDSGAHDNTVGGTNPGEGNLISGNLWSGVSIYGSSTDSNSVIGNYIGTDVTGTGDLGNSKIGVFIGYDAGSNTVGGSTAGHRNVISGNDLEGVQIRGAGSSSNTVEGNYIGLTASGETALGNTLDGVLIFEGASSNTVGGDAAGEGNVISGNGLCGVSIYGSGTSSNVVSGNLVGTEKDGTDARANGLHGIFIGYSATANTIGGNSSVERNVLSGNATNGVRIEHPGTDNNTVQGNYIGLNAAGSASLSNTGPGVDIRDGPQYNTIGGNEPDERNVISGNNDSGVVLRGADTSNNTVSGNYIGTDASGTIGILNSGDGVSVATGAHHNMIGGSTTGHANLIANNITHGVRLDGSGTDSNTVRGNFIGTNSTGTMSAGNVQHGVLVANNAADNTIGPSNIIAFNGNTGIRVSGGTTSGNQITRNRIYQNTSNGIDLMLGANGGILVPTITGTSMGPVTIAGTATSCDGCTIEVFSNPDTDGEGKTYLGSAVVSGTSWSLSVAGIGDPYLTATVTDGTDGTSEFSGVFTSIIRSLFMPLILR